MSSCCRKSCKCVPMRMCDFSLKPEDHICTISQWMVITSAVYGVSTASQCPITCCTRSHLAILRNVKSVQHYSFRIKPTCCHKTCFPPTPLWHTSPVRNETSLAHRRNTRSAQSSCSPNVACSLKPVVSPASSPTSNTSIHCSSLQQVAEQTADLLASARPVAYSSASPLDKAITCCVEQLSSIGCAELFEGVRLSCSFWTLSHPNLSLHAPRTSLTRLGLGRSTQLRRGRTGTWPAVKGASNQASLVLASFPSPLSLRTDSQACPTPCTQSCLRL